MLERSSSERREGRAPGAGPVVPAVGGSNGRGGIDVMCVPVVVAPHSPQYFCVAGFSAPHEGQRAARDVGAPPLGRSSACTSARASSDANPSASWKRSLGSFASALSVTSTSGLGIWRSGATSRGSRGVSVRCMSTTCVGESASNGNRPDTSW